MNKTCNYSAGLCIYCTDREEVIQECKSPSPQAIFMDFCIVTGQVLNNYENFYTLPNV